MTKGRLIPIFPKPIGRVPFGVNYARSLLSFDVDVRDFFEYVDIHSVYLWDLMVRAIWKILHSGFRSPCCFGSIIEGATIAGGIAEVTTDRCIRIDSQRLRQYEDNVAMALVAHELAHDHLRHFKTWKNNLDYEHEADNLAKAWGFNINLFRKTFGPPVINSRLLQIAVIH